VGQATADARREVEETREELGQTIGELRRRGDRIQQRARRIAPYVVAGIAAGAGVVVTVVVIRKRRADTLPQKVRSLPRRMSRRRQEMVEMLAERVAEQQAQAQRRANPLWRRAAAKALETAATAGVAAAVRQATVAGQRRRESRELTGAGAR